MAYDEALAERLRDLLEGRPDVTEKRMFGGLAFLVGGHLAVSAGGHGGLMVRCRPEDTEALCEQPHVAPMVMRGRELAGWLRIEPAGISVDGELARWVAIGTTYARSLPPK